MSILVYLLVPLLIVLAASLVMWMRNRQPTSLQSGVDDFRREMQALSPEALRSQRQRPDARSPVDESLDRPPRSPRSSAPGDQSRRAERG